ncbi:response regulator [Subsaxibacter sp. CAU 1640]|uniref:response regulator n=1 Tax=Subsaxibacter sp. CAU 1640 TaxID=2933271 RepID=UPI0020031267|nr:response regulator [Subsaxibacter sp. CAU 1640]MCK7590763.1 response regulator [Subsaxibacter sp. CAU 1640]
MRLQLLSLFCFFHFIVFAQTEVNVDSLKRIVKNEKVVDSSKCNSYTELIYYYKKKDVDSCKLYLQKLFDYAKSVNSSRAYSDYYRVKAGYFSLFLKEGDNAAGYINDQLQKALSYAEKTKDPKLVFEVYYRLTQENARLGREDAALEFAKEGEKVALKYNLWEEAATIYGQVGKLYNLRSSKTELALKYLLKSDSIYEAHNFTGYRRGFTLSFIGDVYKSFGNLEMAVSYQQQAMTIFKNEKNETQQKFILGKLAIIEIDRGNYDVAIDYVKDAISYYRENQYPIQEANFLVVLSDIYDKNGQKDKALEAGERAIELTRLHKHDAGLMMALVKQADVLQDANNPSKSNALALEAETIALRMNAYEELKDVYELMYSNAESLGNYQQAYQYSKEFRRVSDTLEARKNIASAKELEAKYQSEKKEKEIQLLKAENDLIEQQKTNQRNLLLAGIGIIALVGLFFFMLYRNRLKTNRKLKELDDFKSKLFANISHEFRTPLTLISGYSQKRLEQPDIKPQDKQELETIYRSSNRLEELVNQMLDLAKLESGHLTLNNQKGELSVLLKSIANSFQHNASEQSIDYNTTIGQLGQRMYDTDVIEKIVTNLLSNAFKYTPENGKIMFDAKSEAQGVRLVVKNTTDELTKEQVQQIFNRFYQVNQNATGVGIGLSLVKELVELNHGDISVSQFQGMLVFEVLLPLKSVENSSILRTETVADTLTEDISDDNLMLIIDDNSDIRMLVKDLFKDHYQLLEAENGQQGLKLALEHVPNIVISDVMMPEMDGFELTSKLKSDERTSHIPVILLTAKVEDKDKYQGLETGADDYILKPFKSNHLKARVNNLITTREQLKSRYTQELILVPKDLAITNLDEIFLQKLRDIMETHLTEPDFNVQEFSSAVGMSRMQLHRKLKALTGLTATEFIRSQRLKLAAELLKKSDANISEIGYTVGFNDHSYFTKCFKEAYGCSPTDYVKKHQ